MELILLIGVDEKQKEDYFNDNYSKKYVFVNFNVLSVDEKQKTNVFAKLNEKLRAITNTCLKVKQPVCSNFLNFVSINGRKLFISKAKSYNSKVIAIYFHPIKNLPINHRIQIPTLDEGFDSIITVGTFNCLKKGI